MKTRVVLTTTFSAIHSWPDCPHDDVYYLRTPHRHVFHVTMKFNVLHNDRDIEFIRKKNEVEKYIQTSWDKKSIGTLSCEQLAELLLQRFGAAFVSVYEDNENGAEVYED